jgi:hypothetical protein
MLIALLLVLQSVTKGGGQYVTGSCVNAVLAVAALVAGIQSAAVVSLVSPFAALFLKIAPLPLPIVPAVALGNLVYVAILWVILKKHKLISVRGIVAWIVAAVCKFLTLYLVVVKLLSNLLTLKPQQVTMFTAMFSWPQLVTALVGGGAALLVAVAVRRATKE